MPDTGAPWNIPYVAGTDLVADWPTDSQTLAEAIADGLDLAGNAGIGSNVVQAAKTDTFTTTSTSYTDVTGLSLSITPTSATSKVLVFFYGQVGQSSANDSTFIQLVRDTSAIFVGDAAGSRVQATTGLYLGNISNANAANFAAPFVYLDSPATTSATTYKVQMRVGSGNTATLGRTGNDTNDVKRPRVPSSLIAVEVAA